MPSFAACAQIVRQHDPDRFLLSLLAPASRRGALWALYAFNHEIAKTREVVTETQLGLIRLQWWREAVAAIYAGKAAADHPVVDALRATIMQNRLPQEKFETLIYAREFDLEDRLPASMDGLVNYADYTSTPLLELTASVLDHDTADIRGLAIGYALTGLLRATPLHMAQRRCYLPADRLPLIGQHMDGQELHALEPLAGDIVGIARGYLGDKPGDKWPAILRGHRKLSLMWLRKIEKARFNVFHPDMRVPPVFKELRVMFS